MKRKFLKRSLILVLIVMASVIFCGCKANGQAAAYEIVEKLTAGDQAIIPEATEENDADNDKIQELASAFKAQGVDVKSVNIVKPNTSISYQGITFQIMDIQKGNTIYDIRRLMNQKDSDVFCQNILNCTYTNFSVNSAGSFKDGARDDGELYFIKCKMKNNNSDSTRLAMLPEFYTNNNGTWKCISVCDYAFAGRHDTYMNPKSGIESNRYQILQPGEETEVIFLVGIIDANYYDASLGKKEGPFLDIYMASSILSPLGQWQMNLPDGGYLLPVLIDGKCANK